MSTYRDVCEAAKDPCRKHEVAQKLRDLIKQPEDIVEFMKVYWEQGRTPLSKQVRVGLADVFERYTMKELALHEVAGDITLRGVLALVHAKVREQ